MKLKIKVTKDILKKSMMCGTDKSLEVASNCAIALAIRDIFDRALISPTEIYLEKTKSYKEIFIALPQEAKDFILTFDKLWVIPEERVNLPELEFEIEVPEAYLETVNITELTSIINQSQTLELV